MALDFLHDKETSLLYLFLPLQGKLYVFRILPEQLEKAGRVEEIPSRFPGLFDHNCVAAVKLLPAKLAAGDCFL